VFTTRAINVSKTDLSRWLQKFADADEFVDLGEDDNPVRIT